MEEAGRPLREPEEWIRLAKEKDWISLQLKFDKHFAASEFVEDGDVTLLRNGVNGLGVGTVVDGNKMIFVHHKNGVATIPLHRVKLLQFSRLK